ncbi:G-type lectin S-receptor-like serine/threonine-protein kinase At1g11410 isoform X2 [Benincasa hispida]|uniref:G-type lectin S-receptor-like serine/threonine-protein kinase At1g11410 isoform X2 n=1 Tax=Benincasa hispida TaxID=102211 RepID=UPI0018FFAB14|nr:G-type lectin S-receptor-like serine/threonine-protein kinase At1g11410 isoform X2 [Benincasa hispida]
MKPLLPERAVFLISLFLVISVGSQFSLGLENSNSTFQIIKDGDRLVSSNKNFALGFFSFNNSTTRRYVGIWYNQIPQLTLVWVANRNQPLNDTRGTLALDRHGNVVVFTPTQTISLWSTNATIQSNDDVSVELRNTGNLALIKRESQKVIWQSFDYPSHVLLPYMKLGVNRRTGFSWFLTSWKAHDDPGTGNFSCRIDPTGYPQLVLYDGNVPWWRGGSWTGRRWTGVPEMTRSFIINTSYIDNSEEVSITNSVTVDTVLMRMTLDESGLVHRSTWNGQEQKWNEFWSAPIEWCDSYNRCGPNSNCDPYNVEQFQCKCLPGFEPRSNQNWFLRDPSGGCIRKRPNATCQSGEGFVKVSRVKVPDTSMARVDKSMSLEACEQACLNDCNCTAYTSVNETVGTGCLMWYGDLVDTRTYANVGQDLYVRVDAIELARKRRERLSNLSLNFGESLNSKEFDESRTSSDLPIFDLLTIAKATDNFSFTNKLGEGGFGAVYKGKLTNGEEIAVKRLAKNSGQGVGEFKNEVTLIAKLQHRNLVRILGYCVKNEEKMLVYEYLPNKSLDSFIFDESKRALLNWQKRFEIICGIARGLLYLHQDSRLKIIHRDLKASNILLDADLIPKIADFGMARIFGQDQIQANTNRIVGTYGYMSPEYAMEGLFSVKSDVYSFGILVLEMITGKKNNYDSSHLNLVGHVWELWKLETATELVDSSLEESSCGHEIMRCLQIGLLCVQEDATDRPTMSTVIFMLRNEVALPSPKKPAFILKRKYNSGDPSTSTEGANSVNDLTISIINAR